MFDYGEWLRRAIEFTNSLRRLPGDLSIEGSVQPPLTQSEVDDLAKLSRLPIPDSLRQFWMTATGDSGLRYSWSILPQFESQLVVACGDRFSDHVWGGPEFLTAKDIAELTHDLPSWAEGMRPQYPKDSRLWDHSLPIIPVGNGDYIGLYVRDTAIDPPVVYLCHEAYGGSIVIAQNLPEFLAHWAKLKYIGIDFVVTFCRNDGLLIPAEHPVEVEALSALFRGEVRDDLTKPASVISEREWSTLADPDRLLRWLDDEGMRDERKLRLYCCACCERVWKDLGESGRHVVNVSRLYADGRATAEELREARDKLADGIELGTGGMLMDSLKKISDFEKREGTMQHTAYGAVDAHWFISGDITHHYDDPQRQTETTAQADLVRHIFGNPFRPIESQPIRNLSVVQLATQLYEGKPLARELHNVLLGIGASDLAEHFQSPDHPPGCWALDLILEK